MFLEPQSGRNGTVNHLQHGWIEVVCGSMFSGKTEELIRRLKRAKIAGRHVEIFKPATDTRYHEEHIVSHDDNMIKSTALTSAREILPPAAECDVIGIDEVQFFDKEIVDVCVQLANSGIRIIAAGLDMDYLGKPFGPMPSLAAVAEYVTKVHAVCVRCGGLASYSYRLSESKDQVLLGETDLYEARCRPCFIHGMNKDILVKAEKAEISA